MPGRNFLIMRMENNSLDLALLQSDSIDSTVFNRRHLPELASLVHYEYSVFGSLDFNSPFARRSVNEALRALLFRQLIVEVSKQVPGVHRRDLDFFVTDEWSKGMESHLHFVVRKSPRVEANIDAVLRAFKDVWENQIRAGRCVVERYNPALRGVAYICKRQFGPDGRELQKMPHCNKAFVERMVRDRREGRTPELKGTFYSHN